MNFVVVTMSLIYRPNVSQGKWAVGETVQCEPIRYNFIIIIIISKV